MSTVAVMSLSGLVVAGHNDGLSLWNAEDGAFERSWVAKDERGDLLDMMTCIDFSADEVVAVSGHCTGIVVIWGTSTWQCRLTLECLAQPVVGVVNSADAKRVVAAPLSGERRVWDAEVGGAALQNYDTKLVSSGFEYLAYISVDGDRFLWACWDGLKSPWKGKLIDLAANSEVVIEYQEDRFDSGPHSIDLLDKLSSSAAAGRTVSSWRQGAVHVNRQCELRAVDSEQVDNFWTFSVFDNRLQCAWRSGVRERSTNACLDFGKSVNSIAAAWLPLAGKYGRQHAVVACRLKEKSAPAILHFLPSES